MTHGGLPTTVWMSLYAALAGGVGGIVLALFWTPLLVSERVRALFSIGPTGRLPLNYAVVFVVVSGIHAGLLGGWIESGATPANGITAVVALGLGIPAVGWLVAVVGLPALGYDWAPNGCDLRTKAVLAVGAGWYGIMTILPGVLLAAIAAFPA